MRKIAGVVFALLLVLIVATAAKADPPKTEKKKDDDSKNRADQLAGDIFDKIDKHKKGFINKYEFKKADAQLSSAVKQMITDGVIGQGKPAKDAQETISNFTDGFANADTDHDKKVTLQEFTDYVSRALAAADQTVRVQAAEMQARKARKHI